MILNTHFNISALTIRHETKGEEGYKSEAILIETMRDMESIGETGTEKASSSIRFSPDAGIFFQGLPIENAAWVDGGMCLYFSCPIDIAIVDADESVECPHGPGLGPPGNFVPVISITELKNVEPPLHTNS